MDYDHYSCVHCIIIIFNRVYCDCVQLYVCFVLSSIWACGRGNQLIDESRKLNIVELLSKGKKYDTKCKNNVIISFC